MKNTADEIILSLSKQEFREFKYFLGNGDADEERVDLRLLDLIRKKDIGILRNINAHHQTRKRLKKQLEQFALLENLRFDDSSRIHAQMETAKYLFRKNLPKQGWEYLLKAEQVAEQMEEYGLLDYCFDLQVSYSHNIATPPPHGFSVPKLLDKWKANRSLAAVDSNANAAYALLVHELREHFSRQLSVDIDQLTQNILRSYGLKEHVYDNKLRIYCKIISLVCRALREKREYNSLKEYAISAYQQLEHRKAIDKISPDFLIDILDAICVAALRSRDYMTCEKYTRLYELQAKQMLAHPDDYSYYDFIPSVGVCDLCLCTNRLADALSAITAAQRKYGSYKGSVRIYFLLRINLLAVHFAQGSFGTCIRLYNEIKSLSDLKILEEPGFRLELILFTEIFGILFHYEDGDDSYAMYLLRKLKRKYAVLLKQPDSRHEKMFIKILEQALSRNTYFKTQKFQAEALQFIKMKEFIAGDFEYISMNAWLISKMSGKSYYHCLLDLVR